MPQEHDLLCEDFDKARDNRERIKKHQNVEGYPVYGEGEEVCPYRISRGNYSPSDDEFFADVFCTFMGRACTLEYEGVCRCPEAREN